MKAIDKKIKDIISNYALEAADTTTGMNGYPEWTDNAFYHDKLSVIKEAAEKLKELGCEVNELWMKRKNGQHFWNRYSSYWDTTNLKAVGDQDYVIYIDTTMNEENIKDVIRQALYGTEESREEYYSPDEEIVNEFYSDVPLNEGEAVLFYDANQNSVNYVITDEATGYHDGDVTSYQMAFSIEPPEEKTFEDTAKEQLQKFIDKCIETGSLDAEDWEDPIFEDLENRVEVSIGSDIRFSILKSTVNKICFEKGMTMNIVDTSC